VYGEFLEPKLGKKRLGKSLPKGNGGSLRHIFPKMSWFRNFFGALALCFYLHKKNQPLKQIKNY
jgi:hypothetical protein